MIPYEFEVKDIFEKFQVPVEKSCLLTHEALKDSLGCIKGLRTPLIVKAQVRGWGRGKAGLVKSAENPEEALKVAQEFFLREFNGEKIRYVLVSEKKRILREMYLSFMVSSSPPGFLLLASKHGGVDVEELSKTPGGLLKIFIDPFEGLRDYMVRTVAGYLGVPQEHIEKILKSLWQIFREYNFTLLEVNPLALTEDGVLALDRKGVIDDDASRKSSLTGIFARYFSELDELSLSAFQKGFSVVKLDGDTAVVGNGAGLTMATLDAVLEAGARPGLFLDLGGGADAERVREALLLVLKQQNISKILLNILGGITRCDEVARGVVQALSSAKPSSVKVAVRLSGFMEDEGRRILREAGLSAFDSLEEAVASLLG